MLARVRVGWASRAESAATEGRTDRPHHMPPRPWCGPPIEAAKSGYLRGTRHLRAALRASASIQLENACITQRRTRIQVGGGLVQR
jgi:hypothetical protein